MKYSTDRATLRANLKAARAGLSSTFRAACADKLSQQLITLPSIREATNIAVYHAIQTEMNLMPFIRACWQTEKHCYLPVILPETLKFSRYTEHTPLQKSTWHVPEPICTAEQQYDADSMDVICIPLVGFDAQANRLGQGAGHYDRALAFTRDAEKKPLLIGIAYECQRVAQLPVEPWDIPMDMVITEERVYDVR
ncbi:MAG: 5-formyltetrahydrofolate cyclo-ligase [marine bacterium B5-7]|nr:MAG: 5-formyltetrahydrofolate cyclo-ligase [marine bacterium B5-7]